jgi:NitT/TauT family transport system substrate-binding protein
MRHSPKLHRKTEELMKSILAIAFGVFMSLATQALALDKVTFATNWLAEAEHGGFYQALADGTYAQYGLDVTILQGGPQTNNRLLLASGKIDFNLGANLFQSFDAVVARIPLVTIAAFFQKDPFILMSHPGQGLDRFEDLHKANIFIGRDALVTVYQWLKSRYGFSEDKIKPYSFNSSPFIADKASVEEGYVTSEPFEIERQGGFKPNVFLLADYGYNSYSTTIETRKDVIEQRPDLVQRFVNASILGWIHYLGGDPSKANALIKHDNPDISDAQLAYSISKLKEYGIVDSGDAKHLGVGAMTDERIKSFFEQMVKAGLYKPDLDYKSAYSLAFVNKGFGLPPKSP